MDEPIEDIVESQDLADETPVDNIFMPPSIKKQDILAGTSYTHMSPIPENIREDMSTECVLGVDEAGRGPVLGITCNPITHQHLLTTKQDPWFMDYTIFLFPSIALFLQTPITLMIPKS